MWIISKDGFISVVEHKDDPTKVRVRARKREHLAEWFPSLADEIIDFGETPPDYRWHLDVDRVSFTGALIRTGNEIDYKSHAKEAMSKKDRSMYGKLMRIWGTMMELQGGKRRRANGQLSWIDEPTIDWQDPDEDGYDPFSSYPIVALTPEGLEDEFDDDDDDYDLYADEDDDEIDPDEDFEAWHARQLGLDVGGPERLS